MWVDEGSMSAVFIYLINPSLIRALVQLFMNYDSTSIQGIAIWHLAILHSIIETMSWWFSFITFLQYNVCL